MVATTFVTVTGIDLKRDAKPRLDKSADDKSVRS